MTDTNWSLVLDELDNAKRKHPKFVDSLLPPARLWPARWYDENLEILRRRLSGATDGHRCELHHVLECEVYEAFAAYAHGELVHARQELAQCAAVCIRAMEYVEKEMEEKK